jgi:hypothetical protein
MAAASKASTPAEAILGEVVMKESSPQSAAFNRPILL